jgi:hypothetical protein
MAVYDTDNERTQISKACRRIFALSLGERTQMVLNFIPPFRSEWPPVRFDARRVLPIALGALPRSIVSENPLVPIEISDDSLVIAVSEVPYEEDFATRELFDRIWYVCNCEFAIAVVSPEALQYARMRYVLAGGG